MANAWADQLKPGDQINVGDIGDSIEDHGGALDGATWVTVVSVRPCDDGFTDLALDLGDGTRVYADIPSAERVTVRRS